MMYVHQYSYDKELYVDWGVMFVCNVKLWTVRNEAEHYQCLTQSQFLALMAQTGQTRSV